MPPHRLISKPRSNAESKHGATSRLINCFRHPVGGNWEHEIRAISGEIAWVDLNRVFLRDMFASDGFLYAACGGELVRVTPSGTDTTVGTMADGETYIDANNGNLTIAAGGDYYVYDGTSLTQPATGAFDAVGSVTTLNNQTIITEKNGRRFSWSDVLDPTAFDALNYATKEGRADSILRGIAHGGRLYLMGEQSTEIWMQSGSVYDRLSVMDRGVLSGELVAGFGAGIFFVGDDSITYLMDGGVPVDVSIPAVKSAIVNGSPSRCFYFEQEGAKFCAVTFTDRPTWLLDIATGEWVERAKGPQNDPWGAVASVEFDGSWCVGGNVGGLSKLGNVQSDNGAPMYRTIVSDTLRGDGQYFRMAEFEIFGSRGANNPSESIQTDRFVVDESGDYILDADGAYLVSPAVMNTPRAAKVMGSFSRDGGMTWNDAGPRSLGASGEFSQRTLWRAVGAFEQFTVKLVVTDPHDIRIGNVARRRTS